MRSKFKWIFSLLLALSMQFALAQERTITGTVTDPTGPLPGVNVLIKGSKSGVQTTLDGKYSIKAKIGDVLIFSFVGMQDYQATVGASSSLNVKMKDSSVNLQEVVVGAYGRTSTKAKTIGATSTVTAKVLEGRPNVNVLQSLQGQLAGANIALASGQPGTNKIDIIIRGASSLSASLDPLFVIDGVPQTQAFFRNLNSNDIESVSVLKDASATSIYGNRGTNGVIVVTTKKGDFKSDLAVTYSSSYGVAEFRGDDYNLIDARQHLNLQKTLGVGPGATGVGPGITVDVNNINSYAVNTDWKKVFFRTGKTNSQDVSFSLGSENTRSYTSFSYFEQEGIVPTTDFKRFTFRSNFSGKSANNRFTYGTTFTGSFSKRKQLEQETRAGISDNVLQNPLNGYLLSPTYLRTDTYKSGQQLFTQFGSPQGAITPFMLQDLLNKNNAPSFFQEVKTIGSANAAYKLTKNFTVKSTFGVDYAEDKRVFAIGPEAYLSVARAVGAGQPFHGLETQRSNREFSFNLVNQLNYKIETGKHSLDVSAYMEYLKAHRRSFLFQQIGLNPLAWVPGAGTGYIPYSLALPFTYAPTIGAGAVNTGLFSYFGVADYDYDGKYGISATLRRDSSPKFINEYKWATFYSVGGRWNISKENFMANSNFFTDLKLRASYGTSGNQNITARDEDSDQGAIFNSMQIVRDLNSSQQGYGNAPSFGISSVANVNARWETVAQANIGIDFNIKNRLSGSVDVYQKKTTDLYTNIPISYANGITNLAGNNGELGNKGVELSLRYEVLKNTDFKLSVYANGAYNKNEILNLGVLDNGSGLQNIGAIQANAIGGPSNQYFVVPYKGVNPATGNLLFTDINGNDTEAPTNADRRLTNKNRLPVYQGGFGLNSSYKGFFLDAAFAYSAKFFRFDVDYQSLMDVRNVEEYRVSADLLNAWTPTNTNTDVPSYAVNNLDASDISDRFLRDASFIRLRNLSIGYSVPAKLLSQTFIKSVRFRLQGENILTFTKWKGFDPETFRATTTGYFPTPKLYTFGVDINF